jgi:hypothetical protein
VPTGLATGHVKGRDGEQRSAYFAAGGRFLTPHGAAPTCGFV